MREVAQRVELAAEVLRVQERRRIVLLGGVAVIAALLQLPLVEAEVVGEGARPALVGDDFVQGGLMMKRGLRSQLEAGRRRCARMKTGSEMMARQALHTDLNRRSGFTGRRARISVTISSISCAAEFALARCSSSSSCSSSALSWRTCSRKRKTRD